MPPLELPELELPAPVLLRAPEEAPVERTVEPWLVELPCTVLLVTVPDELVVEPTPPVPDPLLELLPVCDEPEETQPANASEATAAASQDEFDFMGALCENALETDAH